MYKHGFIDLTGQRFGRLVVISRAENNKHGDAMWNCVCDCGNTIVTVGGALRRGHTSSCGCLRGERAAIANRVRVGLPPQGYEKRLMDIYRSMKDRCLNPHNAEYSFYGGRGITICNEWLKFPVNFYEWALSHKYANNLTIDRIDNNKGYSPQNCRFISRAEQNRNTSRVHKVLCGNNKYLTASQVAELLNISRSTAAKWYRDENIKTLKQFNERYKQMAERYKTPSQPKEARQPSEWYGKKWHINDNGEFVVE